MIWLLINENSNRHWDYDKFYYSAAKIGLKLKVIAKEKLSLVIDNDEEIIYYDGVEIEVPSLILNWLGSSISEYDKYLFNFFQKKQKKVINNYEVASLFKHKYNLLASLQGTGLSMLKTCKLGSKNYLNVEKYLYYPFLLKGDWGSYGKGIFLIENRHQLKTQLETIELLTNDFSFFFQEYIDKDYELRVYVVGSEYYVVRKDAHHDEYRSNLEKNSVFSKHTLTQEEEVYIEKILTKINAPLMGIDLLIKDGKVYLCEINSAPGFRGLNTALKIEMSDIIINYLKREIDEI